MLSGRPVVKRASPYRGHMSNLGRYQEIVELAKKSGGVDAMIDVIKKGAVADAAPRLVGAGVAAGAALTVGAAKGYSWVKRALASRREAIQSGDTAEEEFRGIVEGSPDSSVLADPASQGSGQCSTPHTEAAEVSTPEPTTIVEGGDDADRP